MNEEESLKWQVEMGADEAISDKSVNRLAAVKNTSMLEHNKKAVSAKPKEKLLDAVGESRSIADKCSSLDELKKAIESIEGLSIKKTATNTVFADGNPESKIMFVGEAPGANEDLSGIPFCGASGKLMDELLKWIGLTREKNIYISNTLFWRPPGNRRPTTEELAICKPFVEKHIALINPKLLVLVGGTATAALLDTKTGISKLRRELPEGKYHEYSNIYLKNAIPAAVLFHPSYLLRQPSQKRHFWFDILKMKHFVDSEITKEKH